MKQLFTFFIIWLSLSANAQFPVFEPVDSGNIKEIITKEHNWKTVSIYDTNGILVQETHYRNGIIASDFLYKRWQKGNNKYKLTISSFYTTDDRLNYELEESIFENKQLIKVNSSTYLSTDTTKKSLTEYDDFVYKDGLLQSYKLYSINWKGTRNLKSFYSMRYDEEKRVKKFFISDIERKQDRYSSKTYEELVPVGLYIYHYNQENKIERIEFEEPSLISKSSQYFSIDYFEYDENGNWVKEYFENSHNEKHLMNSRTIIYR